MAPVTEEGMKEQRFKIHSNIGGNYVVMCNVIVCFFIGIFCYSAFERGTCNPLVKCTLSSFGKCLHRGHLTLEMLKWSFSIALVYWSFVLENKKANNDFIL